MPAPPAAVRRTQPARSRARASTERAISTAADWAPWACRYRRGKMWRRACGERRERRAYKIPRPPCFARERPPRPEQASRLLAEQPPRHSVLRQKRRELGLDNDDIALGRRCHRQSDIRRRRSARSLESDKFQAHAALGNRHAFDRSRRGVLEQ